MLDKKLNILRVKLGSNPNSSSVGSDIPTFLGLAAGLGGTSALIMHVFESVAQRLRPKQAAVTDEADIKAPE
jgi:hypothetical protein